MNEKEYLHMKWSEMPTEQLDEILQQELRKENPEEEVVLGILRILEEREADHPVAMDLEIRNAWEMYHEKTAPSKKSSRKPIWFAGAAAAAVIIIMLMAIPQTVQAESLFDVFFRWTESVFEFFTPGEDIPKPTTAYVFHTDHPGLQQLYDEVTALGATEPVVPMWVPEGFELTEVKTMQMLNGMKVSAAFQRGDSTIMLAYRVSADIVASRHEKEDVSVEMYECTGVYHFIMDNGENLSATWTVDGAECSLSTDVEKETVYEMIKSIYRRKLS